MTAQTTEHAERNRTTENTPQRSESPGAAFSQVLTTGLGYLSAKAFDTTEDWTDRLSEIAEGGGARQQAGSKGIQAGLKGRNPLWAAIKGAWSAGSAKVKAAIVAAVVALVLLLLLSPVLLLVFLLSLLVIAAVEKVRSKSS